jgi:glycosyltransferase involved in cell wall biosynthesis
MEGDMVNPVVTVLMSVYDPPLEMLHKAVASVLGQTFVDFEFLILNDGSRDEGVRAQLDSWASKDRRVRLFHEPHRGVPGTSNRGLELARGKYIARQDADDWSEPHRLQRQAAFLESHPKIALAGADAYSHLADGTPLWRLRLPHSSAELSRALWRGNPFVHGSTMFRREQALHIGGYREQLPCASDYDFLWRLTDAGGAMSVNEVLYHYRYTSGSISARRAADQACVHRAAQVLAATRRRGEPEDIPAALKVAGGQIASVVFRAALKQADHFMLAGNFRGARRAYLRLLQSRPWSGLAWAKLVRLAVFRAIPPAREGCFR